MVWWEKEGRRRLVWEILKLQHHRRILESGDLTRACLRQGRFRFLAPGSSFTPHFLPNNTIPTFPFPSSKAENLQRKSKEEHGNPDSNSRPPRPNPLLQCNNNRPRPRNLHRHLQQHPPRQHRRKRPHQQTQVPKPNHLNPPTAPPHPLPPLPSPLPHNPHNPPLRNLPNPQHARPLPGTNPHPRHPVHQHARVPTNRFPRRGHRARDGHKSRG